MFEYLYHRNRDFEEEIDDNLLAIAERRDWILLSTITLFVWAGLAVLVYLVQSQQPQHSYVFGEIFASFICLGAAVTPSVLYIIPKLYAEREDERRLQEYETKYQDEIRASAKIIREQRKPYNPDWQKDLVIVR